MNPMLFTRAVRRHRYMQDAPAYREFLEYVRDRGDTWLVPQAEVARWWEQRQASVIRWRRDGDELVLESDLARACARLEDGRIEPLPTRIPAFGPPTEPVLCPVYDSSLDTPFFRELLGHLGYGHVAPAGRLEDRAPLASRCVVPLVEGIRESALSHQRYPEAEMEALSTLLRDAHREAGIPDFRLWTLPRIGERPASVALSSRYDVDKAIVNLPAIHDLEESFGLRSTVYLRPMGMFYGRPEIRRYLDRVKDHEIALHGEFVSTAESHFGNEFAAAAGEKQALEKMCGREVEGVCMHGGELRTNTSPRTRSAIELAGYRYETMYRNRYYLPLHLPTADGVMRTLSIGQHYADITTAGTPSFVPDLRDALASCYDEARAAGGVFVPVMHPLYFDVGHYIRQPRSILRVAAFLPRFVGRVVKMKSGQHYSNEASR